MRRALVALLRPLRFRGKARLLGALLPRRGVREATIHGARMRLDLSEHIQRHVYMGAFEPAETAFVQAWLRPGDHFVDVGANVGYFVALAAGLVGPRGRVTAFEPSPYALERLRALVADNGWRHVEVRAEAIGDSPGRLALPAPDPENHTPSLLASPAGRAVTEVEVDTLDRCAAAWPGRRVDLLKLDIEGFEERALVGAEGLLAAGQVRAILVELNRAWLERAGTSPAAILARLEAHGFRLAPPFARVELERSECVTVGMIHAAWI